MGIVNILAALTAGLGLPAGVLISHYTRREVLEGASLFEALSIAMLGITIGVALWAFGTPAPVAAVVAIVASLAGWLFHEIPLFGKTLALGVLLLAGSASDAFPTVAGLVFLTFIVFGSQLLTEQKWQCKLAIAFGLYSATVLVLGMIL